MNSFVVGYVAFLGVLKIVVFALALLLAVVAALDWAVRARRVNPFSPVARFVRSSVDPLIAPVERRVVRAGGLPSNAPWWALAAAVIGGILLISGAKFLGQLIVEAHIAFLSGPTVMLRFAVRLLFGLMQLALLVRVVSSWFGVSPYSRWVRWSYALTEPILRPIRRLIPTVGMFDVSPIAAYVLLLVLEAVVMGVLP